jgi:hypothetical protein
MILVRSNPQFSSNIINLNFKNYKIIHFVDLENIVGRKPLRSENYIEKMFNEFDKYCQNHVDFEKDFLFVAANYFIINQLRLRYDSQSDNLCLIPINGKDGADKLLVKSINIFIENDMFFQHNYVYIASGDGMFTPPLKALGEIGIQTKVVALFNKINRSIYSATQKITYRNFNELQDYKLDNVTVFLMDYISKSLDNDFNLKQVVSQKLIAVKKLNLDSKLKTHYIVEIRKAKNNKLSSKNVINRLNKIPALVKKLYKSDINVTIKSKSAKDIYL